MEKLEPSSISARRFVFVHASGNEVASTCILYKYVKWFQVLWNETHKPNGGGYPGKVFQATYWIFLTDNVFFKNSFLNGTFY